MSQKQRIAVARITKIQNDASAAGLAMATKKVNEDIIQPDVAQKIFLVRFTVFAERMVIAEDKEDAKKVFATLPLAHVKQIDSVIDLADYRKERAEQEVEHGKD